MNVTDSIRVRASKGGDAVAIVRRKGSSVSYRELDRMIDSVGTHLVAAGIEPGDIVVVDIAPLTANLVAILALARFGAIAAPEQFSTDRRSATLSDRAAPTATPGRTIRFEPAWLRNPAPGIAAGSRGGGRDVAIIHPSSGTTQKPKHVAISHECLVHRIDLLERGVPLPRDPRVLCLVRAISAYGFDTVVRALSVGATLMLATQVEEAIEALARDRANHVTLNPLWIERLLEAAPPEGRAFPSLERVEFAGSHLAHPRYLVARERLCPDIWNHYGATEMGLIASAPMAELVDHPQAVGFAAAGVEIEAVGDDGVPLPRGAHGRLRARSPAIVDGYFDDPAQTAAAFRDGWYWTADVGSVAGNGLVTLGGRESEMINIGGYKLSPRAIEDALLSLEGVRDAAVFAVPDPEGITQMWAAVVIDPSLDAATLSGRVQAKLAGYAPRYLLTVPSIPRNEGGKVMRDRLVASVSASIATSAR